MPIFIKNMDDFETKSLNCISKKGTCIDVNQTCLKYNMINYPDAKCYKNNDFSTEIDDTKICCIKY